MTTTSPSPAAHPSQSEKIATDLARRITSGELKAGERLESEHALAAYYDSSRGTVRRALALLQESNLVHTRPGAGSYVAFHGASLAGAQGWTAATAQAGTPTTVEVLSAKRVDTPTELSDATAQPQCWRVVRRRLLDETPVSLEISLIPANERINTVMEYGLLGGSISATLRATGMVTTHGTQDVAVLPLPQDVAESLHASASTPFLMTQRTGYGQDDTLTESVTSWLDPAHFTLHLTFEE